MKLGKCTAINFGSYAQFEFDFTQVELTLIHGTTGSGKSTIPDIVFWALYGETSKDGASDDVRSWKSYAPTKVTLQVDDILITRIRGKAADNDLYWTEENNDFKNRGKDISETQKLLDNRLGVNADTFGTSCYFHEFSNTATFFVAKAKDRRALFDKLADLEFPKNLSDRTAAKRKELKNTITAIEHKYNFAQGRLTQLEQSRVNDEKRLNAWKIEHDKSVKRIETLVNNFEEDKKRQIDGLERLNADETKRKNASIDTLNNDLRELEKALQNDIPAPGINSCQACNQPVESPEHKKHLQAIELHRVLSHKRDIKLSQLESLSLQPVNPYAPEIKRLDKQTNPYITQLEGEKGRINPYTEILEETRSMLASETASVYHLKIELDALNSRLSALNQLYDLSYSLRSELLKTSINALQRHTNKLLTEYFDSAIQVDFSLESLDSVEVILYKDGNTCKFKQLSRGQRALLRLCFVIAVMQAASFKVGKHFDTLFYDEVLDGMDTGMKIKAFRLFESLAKEHSGIVIIDHCQEFQNLFEHRYWVSIENGQSSLNEER